MVGIVEEQKIKSLQSSKFNNDSSSLNPQTGQPEEDQEQYPEINHLLNLIENRIKIYVHLGTHLIQISALLYKAQVLKMLFFKGVVYTLLFHCRNLVNKVLQLLSEEESGKYIFPHNWEEFLLSHDHSIQTDNFTQMATGIYKALWTQYNKMKPSLKLKKNNPLLEELQKMMHQPDSKLSDISESRPQTSVVCGGELRVWTLFWGQ